MLTHTIHGKSQFQKPSHSRWAWESPAGQLHDGIDNIIFNRKICLTDVAAAPKFYTGSDHVSSALDSTFQCVESELRSSEKEAPKQLSVLDHFASLSSLWEDSVSENIDKNTIDSSNIFTKVLGKQRVSK
ncbi:hypothetical protein V3C99_005208 [Haemonchus contortus]|uniref:Ovule protein n=1 Tax=Haemonchus contortus TaxID=6289 RepID=A0A7I4XUD9_HAECO